ncbi:MAG: hypothetical protein NTX24_02050 [Candidatus Pacearchaeota archaeon]|nr:hypothetical protein [Candidatus Pacearchaeota archaeon]
MKKWMLILLIVIGVIVVLAIIWTALYVREKFDGGMIMKKPAIYLYPEKDSFVSVKLDINGKITKTIPKYDTGWNVFVTKQSIIEDKYDYLFYEANLKKIDLLKEGWVVKYEELENWFDIYLIKLGLNEKEKSQFKEYWLNELPKANYYEIRLFDQSFLKDNINLIINPEPTTLIRLNFYFKPLNNNVHIEEPKIETPQRRGFTVVEWGGVLE